MEVVGDNGMSENKSSSLKQMCVNCHFFSYAMKHYNSNQYSEKVVDEYYRNWIKEKCYNYNESTEIPEECDYSNAYNNEKAPCRTINGLKCYKNVWPEEGYIGISMLRIPITPDIKNFLLTVPMYREKAFVEIAEVDRSGRCFFHEYKPGMSFEAAEELGKRADQNKGITMVEGKDKDAPLYKKTTQKKGKLKRGEKQKYVPDDKLIPYAKKNLSYLRSLGLNGGNLASRMKKDINKKFGKDYAVSTIKKMISNINTNKI